MFLMQQLPPIQAHGLPILRNTYRPIEGSLQRHKSILFNKTFFPLNVFGLQSHKREYLARCFSKALNNLNYEGFLEDIERSLLKKIFCEFCIFITAKQLAEGYFFATFSFDKNQTETKILKEYDENFEKEIEKINIKFGFKSKTLSPIPKQQGNGIKFINNIVNDIKINNKFDLRCFILWLSKNISNMRNFTAIEIEQYIRTKKLEDIINQGLNKSLEQPHKHTDTQNTRKENLKKKSNFKGLFDLLEKKKMFNVDHPEIDLKKRPETIVDAYQSFSELQSNASSFSVLRSQRKRVKYNRALSNKKTENGYKYLAKVDQDIKDKIKSCFIDFKEENSSTKKIVSETIKEMYFEKLKNEEKLGIDYAEISKLRLKHAQELNNLKTFQEMVMIMREQENALEATRLYNLLYTNDHNTEEKLKKFNASKKCGTKLKALLRQFPL